MTSLAAPAHDAAQVPGVHRPRRKGVSLTTRLAATLLGVGFLSMVVATLVGISAGQSLGTAIVDERLTSLRTAAATGTSAQLDYYTRLAEQLAGSPQGAAALAEFSAGLSELADIPLAESRADQRLLLDAYQDTYFDPLAERDEPVQVSDILSSDPAAVYLQSLYSVPEEPVTNPIAVSDAGDDSAWTVAHRRFHEGYRTAVTQAELLDVYLVDAANLRIVYSAAKAPDLGTSLTIGPFGGSVVARAAEAALKQDEGVVTDLSFYRAEPGLVVGAAAAAIREGDAVVGIVVLTYDGRVYTDLLAEAARASAGADADPEASDIYLVGADGTTRSDPMTYLADPDEFLDASEAAGVLTPSAREVIDANGTTVLVQPADNATVNAEDAEMTDVTTGRSPTGSEVLVTQEAVANDVGWFTVAEIGVTAAQDSVVSFRQVLLFGSAVFLVMLAFLAVAWSKRFMRPIRVISDRLGKNAIAEELSAHGQPMAIPQRSPVEFHRLIDILNDMGRSLRRQQRDLQEARGRRVEVLQSMLPEAIAQRVARGDIDAVDQVPSASVVVVVMLGLGGLVKAEGHGDRALMDDLQAELDGIGAEHGLDRVKVVGDSYYAACGHDRPYIDHAPRCIAFAESVARAVQAIAQESSVALSTAIGINTGAVTVGMSGGARLVYDVWGPTVSTAHTLARAARSTEILVTQATRARLPDEVDVVRWDTTSSAPGVLGQGGPDGAAVWAVVVGDRTSGNAAAGTEQRR